jgi:hypothetical protein
LALTASSVLSARKVAAVAGAAHSSAQSAVQHIGRYAIAMKFRAVIRNQRKNRDIQVIGQGGRPCSTWKFDIGD